ncbi:hypothetical protein EI555_016631, partial [Monodon monoceros]
RFEEMGTRRPEAEEGGGEGDPSGLSLPGVEVLPACNPGYSIMSSEDNLPLGQGWLGLGNTTLRPQCPFPGRFKDIPSGFGFGDEPFGKGKKATTREYTISIHKHIHGVGFEKHTPWALTEIRKFATEEMRIPDMLIDTRLSKAVWAEGIRNVPYCIHVKCNEDEDSPNKLYTLVTYVSVTTSKNLHSVGVHEN